MEWGNSERIEAINIALNRLSHDQRPVGIGFKLNHDPTHCARCRATISLLELGAIVRGQERELQGDLEVEEVQ